MMTLREIKGHGSLALFVGSGGLAFAFFVLVFTDQQSGGILMAVLGGLILAIGLFLTTVVRMELKRGRALDEPFLNENENPVCDFCGGSGSVEDPLGSWGACPQCSGGEWFDYGQTLPDDESECV